MELNFNGTGGEQGKGIAAWQQRAAKIRSSSPKVKLNKL